MIPAQALTVKETTISTLMEDDIKCWTAKRKSAAGCCVGCYSRHTGCVRGGQRELAGDAQ